MSYYPMPNARNATPTTTGRAQASTPTATTNAISASTIASPKTITFNARYSMSSGPYHSCNCYGNALDPCTQGPGIGGSRQVALNLNHTFSPTTILSVSLGFTRGLSNTQGIPRTSPSSAPSPILAFLLTSPPTAPSLRRTIYMYGGYSSPNGPESIGAQPWSVYKNGNQVYHLLGNPHPCSGTARAEVRW